MIDNFPNCSQCPLQESPAVRGSGDPGGLAIVIDSPSISDVGHHRLLSGRSGRLLETILQIFNSENLPIYVTSACACRCSLKQGLPQKAIDSCRPRLLEDLNQANPQKILILGKGAQRALYPEGSSLMTTRGQGIMIPLESRDVYGVISYAPETVLKDDELARDLFADVEKVFSRSALYPLPEPGLTIVHSIDQGLEVLSNLRSWDLAEISCDLETTGFDPLTDSVLSIGFGIETSGSLEAFILPRDILQDPQVFRDLLNFFLTFQGAFIFHNVKFDLQFLQKFFDTKLRLAKIHDTMLMQYCCDERGESEGSSARRSFGTKGLKDQARIRYDIPDYHFDFKTFFSLPEQERDYRQFYIYHGMDCILTLLLFRDLSIEFEETPELWDVMNHLLIPGTLALSDAELYGITIDREYLASLEQTVGQQFDDLWSKLQSIASSHGFENFNPRSSPQKIKLLAKCGVKTKSTAKDVIQSLLRSNISGEGKEILELLGSTQQLSGVLNTYIRGIASRLGPDGRIHPDFVLDEAATGRLACRNPNLQNIPVLMGNQIRNAFSSRPGYTLCDLDYSQLELRVAAYYSQDDELIRIFQEGLDIHTQVAARMFNKPESQVTKYERYLAKYVDFGIIYGRGAHSLSSGWEMDYLREMGGTPWTLTEAEFFIDEFLKSFPGLASWIESQHRFVVKHGYVFTPLGRRRRFPFITRENVYHVQRRAVNTPIQSLASDICLMALIRVTNLLPEEAHLINTVHDSLMFEVPTSRASELISTIKEEMIRVPPHLPDFNIPLVVDYNVGITWGEMEKFADGSNT